MVTGFEDWALELGSNTELDSLKEDLIQSEKSDNIEMVMQRTAVFQLRQKPILNYPIGKKGLNTVQREPCDSCPVLPSDDAGTANVSVYRCSERLINNALLSWEM